MTEQELIQALEQNGSASAVLLKEAFDILNSKISGISAQDPRIIGHVSAQSPATLGTDLYIGSRASIGYNASIGDNAIIGHDASISEGAIIGDHVRIGGYASIGQGVTIGSYISIDVPVLGTADALGRDGFSVGPFALVFDSYGMYVTFPGSEEQRVLTWN